MFTEQSSGVFKGVKLQNGERSVTINAQPLNLYLESFNHSRMGFDWGYEGSGPLQLSFAILMHVANEMAAKQLMKEFLRDKISKLNRLAWELDTKDVLQWVRKHKGDYQTPVSSSSFSQPTSMATSKNIVKDICNELDITQKRLAAILEVPEGTVSSWAVKNELPRLAKKAIEFYILNQKNEAIVKRFKSLIELVNNT
jgi:DNA-binding transcriptional regulator YiaG